MADRLHSVAVIAGDGIGREVVPAAIEVIEAAGRRFGFATRLHEKPWGCDHRRATGSMMPASALDEMAGEDAILLGAVGHPDVPDHVSLWELLIPIRRAFDQYVNLRPVRLFAGVTSPLRNVQPADLDLVIVRENGEGEYSEVGGRLLTGHREEVALQVTSFSQEGVDRILRFAFGLAEERSGVLTSATKSNGIVHTMPFWDERVALARRQHPGVRVDQQLIDALCARLVLDPRPFDVIVASNLFGDILSDLAAALAGSIGMAPSGNINPERRHPSMFEPVHGSAPDIAGRGIANPIGTIWSAAMMLDHLGEADAAAAIVAAIEALFAQSDLRTADLGGSATTTEITRAIAEHVRES